MIDLSAKPFYLSKKDIAWVKETLEQLSLEEKIGQLFCVMGIQHDKTVLSQIINAIQPGAIMFRPDMTERIAQSVEYLQSISKVPLLISANLEEGAACISPELTHFGNNMQVAATGDSLHAYRQGLLSGTEAAGVGCNWSFSPVVDINMNFRNPITNVRSYGDAPDKVISMAKAFFKGMKESGVAITLKHFPGDGVDERDHHLLTTCNSLSKEEWMNTFGRVYQEMIDEGAQAIMAGHITLPALQKEINPELLDSDLKPATLSPELLTSLLRQTLGFNGLIVTDSSLMVGLSVEAREKVVPEAIAAGCDMFLFTRNMEEDFNFMRRGVLNGTITMQRLEEAVTRILGLKAAQQIHKPRQERAVYEAASSKCVKDRSQASQWQKECIDRAITLVKDTQQLLPIHARMHRRVLIYSLYSYENGCSHELVEAFAGSMKKQGFDVEVYDAKKASYLELFRPVGEFRSRYDLVIYLSDIKPYSNQPTLRPRYGTIYGTDFPQMTHEIPTILISFGSPYLLFDLPMMKTCINVYNNQKETADIVVAKLTGQSEFYGISPADPFCGVYDTKL